MIIVNNVQDEIAPDTSVANQLLASPVSGCLRVTLFNGRTFWFVQIEKSIFRTLPGHRKWLINLIFDRVDTANNRPVDIVDDDDFGNTPVREAPTNESINITDTFFDMFGTPAVINKNQAVQTSPGLIRQKFFAASCFPGGKAFGAMVGSAIGCRTASGAGLAVSVGTAEAWLTWIRPGLVCTAWSGASNRKEQFLPIGFVCIYPLVY